MFLLPPLPFPLLPLPPFLSTPNRPMEVSVTFDMMTLIQRRRRKSLYKKYKKWSSGWVRYIEWKEEGREGGREEERTGREEV